MCSLSSFHFVIVAVVVIVVAVDCRGFIGKQIKINMRTFMIPSVIPTLDHCALR